MNPINALYNSNPLDYKKYKFNDQPSPKWGDRYGPRIHPGSGHDFTRSPTTRGDAGDAGDDWAYRPMQLGRCRTGFRPGD